MPVWMQIFYSIFSVVILGWGGWMTKLVFKHDKALAMILQRCGDRQDWIQQIDREASDSREKIDRIDRNIVRLGGKLGCDVELEKP